MQWVQLAVFHLSHRVALEINLSSSFEGIPKGVTNCVFLLARRQIWCRQPVFLQAGGWCVNRPVFTDKKRCWRLAHQQIWWLMEMLLVRRQISEAKSQYLHSTVSTENRVRNGALSTTSTGGWWKLRITSHRWQPNCFYWAMSWLFCHHHPASSGICWQPLLSRNTQSSEGTRITVQ